MLSAILANANRNPEETPEPFTVNDFIQWLTAPFEEVSDAEEDVEDWEDELEEPEAWPEEDPVPATDEQPAWKQWKRNIRAYAESVAPTPTLPPNV